MLNFTKFALKRPVTVLLALVTLIFFGMQSVLGAKLELMPEMEMPMMIVATTYAGASPEDVNDLISKEIEDAVATLSGKSEVDSYSMENVSIVLIQYDYGTNMDTAYMDLKKAIDGIKSELPEDADESNIVEMDMNAQAVITMAVSGGTEGNLYNYVNNEIVPELEKLSSVGDISLAGGQESYVRIELLPEQMSQYRLDMSTVAQIVGAADFAIPAGKTKVGDESLSVSVGNDYDDIESLKSIAIPLASGDTIHLSDIANVYEALEEADSIGRYNKNDVVSISIQKQQSASAVEVSEQVLKEVENLKRKNPALQIEIINDSSELIMDSLESVMTTLGMAVVLSMLVLFLFFGDVKASLIVGSSIPISVVVALILMRSMGFSLNVISLGALVLGVGMMVDNSIVMLESCFRSKEKRNYYDAAIEGARLVINSLIGSTATTCVVFLPLALLQGLSGQMFKPLGFTIVFCMMASLFSAVIIVPLMYLFIHPHEKTDAPVNKLVSAMQDSYRVVVRKIIPKKKTVLGVSVLLLSISFIMAGNLGVELITAVDEGIVNMTITTKPGLTVEANNKILTQLEDMVMADEDVDRYLLTYGASGLSISTGDSSTLTAYLKDDRSLSTDEVIKKWRQMVKGYTDCTITMESGSTSMSSMTTNNIEIDIESVDYDAAKAVAQDMVEQLKAREDVTKVHSSVENAAPVIKVNIDPVKAQAEGLTPASIGGIIYSTLSGSEVMTLNSTGEDMSVRVEYAPDEYDTIDKMEGLMISTPRGTQVPLSDIGEIYYADSPLTIERRDKQYEVAITCEAVEGYEETAEAEVKKFAAEYQFPAGVSNAANAMDEMMAEELGALAGAIGTAVFLIFVVMAMQFESPKFSLMVMFSIPFSLIGAFGLLYLAKCKISMVSMLGFLMMIGTVVNNGILYVDTVNQLRGEKGLETALVEGGAIRLRPILMTTLTTVLSMLPMAFAYGESGETMQGLALVNVGGLMASTILSLIMLPTIYPVIDKMGRKHFENNDHLIDD
ncbi:efflux RND transporter permease subunit [Lachnoclostridium edouardi]|uniref:efflux RND transporter permease subunit n=1 Tax=Lachnoclostridium edouardi TaxID=1926283 RepID=UPI000C7A262E|nr:efflux RND transporter permease subunit [Lachnoclostridium edouardi]